MFAARRQISRSLSTKKAALLASCRVPLLARTQGKPLVHARSFAAPAWLKHPDQFERRHNGPRDDEEKDMLSTVGASSMRQLIEETIPSTIRNRPPLKIGEAMTETDASLKLFNMVSKNKLHKSYIGMGYYNTITPPPILRNIIQNPGWYTPYTPYQAEISQGRMESLVNYQTMIADITAMDVGQASLLDEATAAAEAMAMCQTICKSKRKKMFISDLCNPQTIAVCQTRAEPMDIEVVVGNVETAKMDSSLMGVLLPYPATDGTIRDYNGIIKQANENKVTVVMISDLLALTMLKPPGEIGADIVVGNTQRFGVPLGYGGPHAAFLTCKDAHKRAVPGIHMGIEG